MIYLFIVLLLCVLSFGNGRYKVLRSSKFWLILLYFVFALIAGLRYDRGADTFRYVDFFDTVPTLGNLSAGFFKSTRFLPGFVVFYSLCKTIIPNISFALLVEAFFVNYAIFKFITRYSKYPFIALLCYFIINYFEFNMDIQRESIAVALGLLGWMSYDRKKYGKAIICTLFALTFHISAVMILTYPILSRIQISKTSICFFVIAGVIIPLVLFSIPNLYYIVAFLLNIDDDHEIGYYAVQQFNSDINYKGYLIHILHLAFLCFILFYLKRQTGVKIYAGFPLLLAVLFLLSTISYGFYRFANYLCPFYWIVLTEFIVTFSRKFVKPVAIAAFFSFFLYLTYYHEQKLLFKNFEWTEYEYNYENYIPYKSILFDGSYKYSNG